MTIDLGQLQAVNEFAGHIADEVAQGTLLELSNLVIGTADHWNLVGPLEMNSDGCRKTFRVFCLTHFALVLCLLGSFQATSSRVVLLAGNGHEPGKNPLEKIPPSIPSNAAEAVRDAARRAAGEADPGERKYLALLKPEPGSQGRPRRGNARSTLVKERIVSRL